MPANETVERLAAAAWIRFEPVQGGDPVLGLRSQVSTKNLLITPGGPGSTTFATCPLILLPLDREFTRRETTVQGQIIQTVGNNPRADYPWALANNEFYDETTPADPDTRLLVEPIHLDWIGDFSAPSWLPFALSSNAPFTVPAGFDLNLYNAIALMPHSIGGSSEPMDICVHIFKHPPIPEGVVATVQANLKVEEEA